MLHDFALNSVHFFCNQSVPICIYILTYTNFGNISGCLLQTTYFVCVILLPFNQGCRSQGGHGPPSLILTDQLALYQPEGAIYAHQIATTPLPPDFQTFLRLCSFNDTLHYTPNHMFLGPPTRNKIRKTIPFLIFISKVL